MIYVKQKMSHRELEHKFRPHEWDGWIEMMVEGQNYVMPCPHCMPSYLLYRPNIMKHEICVHGGKSKTCKKCFEPECEFSQIYDSTKQIRPEKGLPITVDLYKDYPSATEMVESAKKHKKRL